MEMHFEDLNEVGQEMFFEHIDAEFKFIESSIGEFQINNEIFSSKTIEEMVVEAETETNMLVFYDYLNDEKLQEIINNNIDSDFDFDLFRAAPIGTLKIHENLISEEE